MTAEISDELRTMAAAATPDGEIRVIVTIANGGDFAPLAAAGLRIDRAFASIPAVSGVLPARHLADLADVPGVERVEFDGEMRAL